MDTKRKELVGPFKNGEREWHPVGEPEHVQVHDFPDKDLGKAIPFGVFDLSQNEGWVSVGMDHDTARFAEQAIHRWWKKMGSRNAQELLITADGGYTGKLMAQLATPSQQGLRTSSYLGRIHDPYRIRTPTPAPRPLVLDRF